jgi:hypothetical protein
MAKALTLCAALAAAFTLSCGREQPAPAAQTSEAADVASDDVRRL